MRCAGVIWSCTCSSQAIHVYFSRKHNDTKISARTLEIPSSSSQIERRRRSSPGRQLPSGAASLPKPGPSSPPPPAPTTSRQSPTATDHQPPPHRRPADRHGRARSSARPSHGELAHGRGRATNGSGGAELHTSTNVGDVHGRREELASVQAWRMGDAEGELQLLSGTICPSSCCRLQRRLRLGAPGRRQLQLLLRPPPPRPEHPVRTRYGSVSVSVYGDEDKPALITYPDVALNCSANHRFIYTDLELSNSYLDIGDNGKISCKISSDFVSPRSSFKIRTSCFISLFL